MHIETERLILRTWQTKDYLPFAQLNADPEVMRYFPEVLTRAESDDIIDECKKRTKNDGFCFMAVELKVTGEFVGMVGLNKPRFEFPKHVKIDVPCVEIGWRLAKLHWHKGYATEAARAVLAYGFDTLGLDEIVSFTSVQNIPSIKVMERIDMNNTGQQFLHPNLPKEHELAAHVLYKISRQAFTNSVQT